MFNFISLNKDSLYKKITNHLSNKELYVRDAYACANDDCKINNEHLKKLLINLSKLGPGNSIAPIYFDT